MVAEDHLNYLASAPTKNLPGALSSILKKSSVLFLGYSPNDSDLQLIVHRLWQEDKLPNKSQLVHQSQPGNLEKKMWED
ncbi:SIR2 family protein [Leptodesmis sp.]|uniref:SIR2 family protein n=1 Tax=Leptodesmis sp. TaxID=3100501 RepID=UPI00405353D7